MNSRTTLLSILAVAGIIASTLPAGHRALAQGAPAASTAAPMPLPPGEHPATYSMYSISVEMQASGTVFKEWPGGGRTLFHGMGFLMPFGGAEYYCGEDFPESREVPLADWQLGLFKAQGVHRPMFCVYVTDGGNLYVYDAPAGVQARTPEGGEHNQMIEIVVGGSGRFQGATGLWTGVTDGRGAMADVGKGQRLPPVLIQLMTGFVKTPLR